MGAIADKPVQTGWKDEPPQVLIIRINGENLEGKLRQRFEKEGYSIDVLQAYQALQAGAGVSPRTVALVCPCPNSTGIIDTKPIESIIKEYVGRVPVALVSQGENCQQFPAIVHNNLIRVSEEELAKPEGSAIEGMIKKIRKFQLDSTPKGMVLIYDPQGALEGFATELRTADFWTERSTNLETFVRDYEFNKSFIQSAIVDYVDDGQKTIDTIRQIPHAKTIAVASRNTASKAAETATYTVMKNPEIPRALIISYLKRKPEQDLPEEQRKQGSTGAQGASSDKPKEAPKDYNHFFLIMGAPASGKTTVSNNIADLLGDRMEFVNKVSTRPLRPGEQDGVDFIKVDDTKFNFLKNNSEFLFTFEYRGYRYGIPRPNTMQVLAQKKHLLMVNPYFGSFEATVNAFKPWGTIPILLFADHQTLEKRIVDRGFGSDIEKAERLTHLSDDEQMFDENIKRFPYTIYTNNIDTVEATRRIISIIKFSQGQQWTPETTFESANTAYVNQILNNILGKSHHELIGNTNGVVLQLDRQSIKDYCYSKDLPGVKCIMAKHSPLKVAAVTTAYGHVGVFFSNKTQNKQINYFERAVIIDVLGYQLANQGITPKIRRKQTETDTLSRFALVHSEKPAIIDHSMYSLVDDYMLRPVDATPHSISFGFVKPGTALRQAPFPVLESKIILNTDCGHDAYDAEIKRAYLRTLEAKH